MKDDINESRRAFLGSIGAIVGYGALASAGCATVGDTLRDAGKSVGKLISPDEDYPRLSSLLRDAKLDYDKGDDRQTRKGKREVNDVLDDLIERYDSTDIRRQKPDVVTMLGEQVNYEVFPGFEGYGPEDRLVVYNVDGSELLFVQKPEQGKPGKFETSLFMANIDAESRYMDSTGDFAVFEQFVALKTDEGIFPMGARHKENQNGSSPFYQSVQNYSNEVFSQDALQSIYNDVREIGVKAFAEQTMKIEPSK